MGYARKRLDGRSTDLCASPLFGLPVHSQTLEPRHCGPRSRPLHGILPQGNWGVEGDINEGIKIGRNKYLLSPNPLLLPLWESKRRQPARSYFTSRFPRASSNNAASCEGSPRFYTVLGIEPARIGKAPLKEKPTGVEPVGFQVLSQSLKEKTHILKSSARPHSSNRKTLAVFRGVSSVRIG